MAYRENILGTTEENAIAVFNLKVLAVIKIP